MWCLPFLLHFLWYYHVSCISKETDSIQVGVIDVSINVGTKSVRVLFDADHHNNNPKGFAKDFCTNQAANVYTINSEQDMEAALSVILADCTEAVDAHIRGIIATKKEELRTQQGTEKDHVDEHRQLTSSSSDFDPLVINTTNPTVPSLIKELLLKLDNIDENAQFEFPAEAAVEALEKIVGWDTANSDLIDPTFLQRAQNRGISTHEDYQGFISSFPPPSSSPSFSVGSSTTESANQHTHSNTDINSNSDSRERVFNGKPLYDLVDIVIPTIRNLTFLKAWRPFIEHFHLIIVQDGDPDVELDIPPWADFELYNRRDIEATLDTKGQYRSWMISKYDASIRNFGFLVSDREFVFTLDDDCYPAKKAVIVESDGDSNSDSSGKTTSTGFRAEIVEVDAILEHIQNLLSPATPYFYNTVYDPYAEGVDFVRGFPYSMREGVRTVVSHGLWLNNYDYDAPTQLFKGKERNRKYVDAAMTVPHGVLYPMCSMNIAFNKRIIGPAFMQGLMGKGHPWARYDDMFAGWASKVVTDHLGYGTKSGSPYVHHNKASNPFNNLKKEYKGLYWQEDIISFFQHNVSFTAAAVDASSAYLELADQVSTLVTLSPYFQTLAEAMRVWVRLWRERFGSSMNGVCDSKQAYEEELPVECVPRLLPVASRSSMIREGKRDRNLEKDIAELISLPSSTSSSAILPSHSRSCAVFTIVHNENNFLPIWLRYYLKHVDVRDIWILDHNTVDNSTHPDKLPPGINYRRVHGEPAFMPHHFLNRQIERHAHRLLRAGYPCYLFAEADEFLVPDPARFPGGLGEYMASFAADPDISYKVSLGYDMVHISEGEHSEPAIDLSSPIMQQRGAWTQNQEFYNKVLLSKVPLIYRPGFHKALSQEGDISSWPRDHDDEFVLIHLHSFDKDLCVARETHKYYASQARQKEKEKFHGINFFAKSYDLDHALRLPWLCGKTMVNRTVERIHGAELDTISYSISKKHINGHEIEENERMKDILLPPIEEVPWKWRMIEI